MPMRSRTAAEAEAYYMNWYEMTLAKASSNLWRFDEYASTPAKKGALGPPKSF